MGNFQCIINLIHTEKYLNLTDCWTVTFSVLQIDENYGLSSQGFSIYYPFLRFRILLTTPEHVWWEIMTEAEEKMFKTWRPAHEWVRCQIFYKTKLGFRITEKQTTV